MEREGKERDLDESRLELCGALMHRYIFSFSYFWIRYQGEKSHCEFSEIGFMKRTLYLFLYALSQLHQDFCWDIGGIKVIKICKLFPHDAALSIESRRMVETRLVQVNGVDLVRHKGRKHEQAKME